MFVVAKEEEAVATVAGRGIVTVAGGKDPAFDEVIGD